MPTDEPSAAAPCVVDLVAGFRDGEPVYEMVPAVHLGGKRYRLIATPGFALGVAHGDEVEIDAGQRLGYRVLARGGNVGVQVFLRHYTPNERRRLVRLMGSIGGQYDGGRGDGKGASLLIFAIPIAVGFEAIERVMSEASERFAIDQWLYANVYDPMDGVTLLNWWE
jgi:hypothetical protein